jgi:hypothetical protein
MTWRSPARLLPSREVEENSTSKWLGRSLALPMVRNLGAETYLPYLC